MKNETTDEELIARLRAVDVSWSQGGEDCAAAADRIEALVKYRDAYAKMERIATEALRKAEARAAQASAEDAHAKGETAGQMLERLGMDGAKWAAEFRTTALRLGYSDMDEGWLIGWFCNAIMAGHDRSSAARDDYYERWNDCQGKRMAAEAEVEKLRGALEAAEAWIVDGGYLDHKDPYVAESAACVYGQTRAALASTDAAQARVIRNGEHLFNTAKSLGWADDGEGALEFVMRRTREVALEDAAKAAAQADYEARILAALAPTDAAHVNETPKTEHDAGNVLTAAQTREAAMQKLIDAYEDIIDYGPLVLAKKDQWERVKAAKEKLK